MSKFEGKKINPKRFHISQLKFYVLLLPLAIIMVLPIIYLFSTAFKPAEELYKFPPSFFVVNPTWNNFKSLFELMSGTDVPASRYLFNSILITVLTVVISVALSLSTGYVLSKKNFRGKKLLLEINTLAMMFVPIAVTIPRFILIVNLGLVDRFISNILPIVTMPVGLFLIKQFIDQTPDALIEAAKMDGATELGVLFRVIFPMVKPAIATVAILSFQSAWGNVEASVYYLNNESLKSFAYYVQTFSSANTSTIAMGVTAASALIMFLPNLIIFIVMQSRVMDTMAYSGIK
ncbi:MAG: carbohydrate ABC transporter permease [Clostridia bacterium]|nr:carbohydrate ABC transporter permease [Clostridia bacterium]